MKPGRDGSVLLIEDKVVGVNLGADYCAEHEWGIQKIRDQFGIDKTKLGLEARKINKRPDALIWLKDFHEYKEPKTKKLSKWSGFYFERWGDKPYINAGFYDQLTTAWDEGSFAALSSDEVEVSALKEIFDAFANNDIAIWIGGKDNPFRNAGLAIAIASRLPAKVTDAWYQFDVDQNKLMADFKSTGIEEKLRKAGKGFFALSPRREEDGSLIFWLNPTQQDVHNYGWFKLEELEDWIKNEGPIPKRK